MNPTKRFWLTLCSVFIAQILFSPRAYAAPVPGTVASSPSHVKQWLLENAQAVAITATILLIILLAVIIFKVGPEKIARKVYELLKLALTDSTGRSVVVAVFVVIALGVGFGLYNSEIFDKLKDSSYARGVITYLITIATIGLVFILVLQIMFVKEEAEGQIKGAREVLTILTGILGTIVGFYFGQSTDQTQALRVAQLAVSPIAEGKERVTAFVEGGVSPYNYILSFGDDVPRKTVNGQSSTGVIVEDLTVADPADVEVNILDAHNSAAKRSATAPPAPAAGDGANAPNPSPPGVPPTP
jgi:hypothetical protein